MLTPLAILSATTDAGILIAPTVADVSSEIQPEYMEQVLGNYIDDALANSNHIVGVHYSAFFIAAPCGTWPGWINPGNRLNQADTPDYSLLWASRRALHDMYQKSPE